MLIRTRSTCLAGLLLLCSSRAAGWTFGNGRFAWLSDCSGHGTYNFRKRACECEDGWGSASDISLAKSPRCDVRICPAGPSLASLPSSTTVAHAWRECSGAGICERDLGECACFDGFSGRACERCKLSFTSRLFDDTTVIVCFMKH